MLGCLPQVWGPSIQSEGQAAGKLGLEAPGSIFLAPSISSPYTPDLGVTEIIHGSEVGNKQGARLGDLEEAALRPQIPQHLTALWSPVPPLPKTR